MSVLRIGMVGTFDVENFGDLLFPLMARRELEQRLGPVDIRPYSYHARDAASWPFEVTPLASLPAEIGSLDLLLVGGGDIIRFDSPVALDYQPNSPSVHHPTGFWLAPILCAHTADVPVAWNAPGLPLAIPDWAHPLVRASVAVSEYVSVRDQSSRRRLLDAVADAPVEVVPDSGFNASMLLFDPCAGADYLLVQSRPESTQWIRRFRELRPDGPSQFVIVPVGPVTGDVLRPPAALPPGTSFRDPTHPREMLEWIAGSNGVLGPSLHLTIAALSLGLPAWRPKASPLPKYRMLDGIDGVHQLDSRHVESSGRAPDPSQLADLRRRLAKHWDSIAALAANSTRARHSRRGWEPELMALWQGLPSRLERRSPAARLRTTMHTAVARFRRVRSDGRLY